MLVPAILVTITCNYLQATQTYDTVIYNDSSRVRLYIKGGRETFIMGLSVFEVEPKETKRERTGVKLISNITVNRVKLLRPTEIRLVVPYCAINEYLEKVDIPRSLRLEWQIELSVE